MGPYKKGAINVIMVAPAVSDARPAVTDASFLERNRSICALQEINERKCSAHAALPLIRVHRFFWSG